jgi:hypothetical protein
VTAVLIADDDANIRDLVAFNLEQAGYEVITAEDGRVGSGRRQRYVRFACRHRPKIAVRGPECAVPLGISFPEQRSWVEDCAADSPAFVDDLKSGVDSAR